MQTRRVSDCSAPFRRSERSARSLRNGVIAEEEVEDREPQAVSCLFEAPLSEATMAGVAARRLEADGMLDGKCLLLVSRIRVCASWVARTQVNSLWSVVAKSPAATRVTSTRSLNRVGGFTRLRGRRSSILYVCILLVLYVSFHESTFSHTHLNSCWTLNVLISEKTSIYRNGRKSITILWCWVVTLTREGTRAPRRCRSALANFTVRLCRIWRRCVAVAFAELY